MLGALNNFTITTKSIDVDGNQPSWPISWILADADPQETSGSTSYRDIQFTYYYINNQYLYLRLECYGTPDFNNYPDSRYKMFIDTDNPHNMGSSGSKFYESEFLFFIEDSSKLGADGIGDIYLLEDLNNNGFINDDWPDYIHTPGRISDTNIAGYRIIGNCLDFYICLNNINNVINPYITWTTDQGDPNLDAAPNIDRSNCFWNAELLKSDLSIIKTDSGYSVYPGDSFTYNLNITNCGPDKAYYINIIDNLPSEISYNFSDYEPNIINPQTYWWVIPFLDSGSSISINLGVKVNDNATGTILNTAQVISDSYDPMPGNNLDTIQTVINITSSNDDSSNDNSTDNNSSNDNSTDNNSSNDNSTDNNSSNDNSTDNNSSNDNSTDNNSSNDNSTDNNSSNDNSTDNNSSNDNSTDNDGSYGGFSDEETSTGGESNSSPVENLSAGKNNDTIDTYNPTTGDNQLNYPPSNPDINGPTIGIINIEYNFSIVSTDINNNNIKYMVDWGDGTSSESDSLEAGEYFETTHKWIQPGNYNIKVSADDNQTNSTNELTITINEPKQLDLPYSSNFGLIPILLLALLLLLLLILAEKRRKDKEEQKK
jgi:hypothetical protein